MQDVKENFESVIEDIIESAEILSEKSDFNTIELSSDEDGIIELELLFSFKINDSMYALCLNEDSELLVLRRDQIHRSSSFVLVESEIELTEVRDALKELRLSTNP